MRALRFPQAVLFPGTALLLLLGSAWRIVLTEGQEPEAALFQAATRFHRALFEGDVGEAASWFEGRDLPEDLRRHAGSGWFVTGVDAETGRVEVLALSGGVPTGKGFAESWQRGNDGAWRLRSIEPAAVRLGPLRGASRTDDAPSRAFG